MGENGRSGESDEVRRGPGDGQLEAAGTSPPDDADDHWLNTITDAELAVWYQGFEATAAAGEDPGWHGPHVGAPVPLSQVRAALAQETGLSGEPPLVAPSLRQSAAVPPPDDEPDPGHRGSRLHNLWHLLHGG
jgi:hypothetical protein